MIGQGARRRSIGGVRRRQTSLGDETGEIGRVVDDLVVAAELAVLVGDRVEAMRAGRHDRRRPVALERLDIALSKDLVDVLVAHSPGGVTAARLFLPKHREVHAGRVEAGREGTGDLPIAIVEGGRATDPVQAVEAGDGICAALLDHIGGGADREWQAPRPVEPCAGRLAPWVAVALHVGEGGGELGREAGILEHQVATQPDDLVDVLDEHRAGLDTGSARDAVPDGVIRDGGVDDGPSQGVSAGRAGRLARGIGAADEGDRGQQADTMLGFDRHLAQAHDERLGVQRLAGRPGRAGSLATAALGAGEAIEEVLPAQVLDRLDPESGRFGFQVHGRQLSV